LRHQRLLRLPLAWWAGVALVTLVTGLVVHSLVSEAAAARDRYGEAARVVVVQRAVDAGDEITAADVRVESRPVGVVPASALREPPIGRAVRVALVPGEVLVRERVAPDGLVGPAAAVPEGWRGVTVPLDEERAPPVMPGDRVDVLITVVGADADEGLPTVVAATDAMVLDVAEVAVTIAVPEGRAPRVAFGLAAGHVTLALRGA
jgi:Flp pilus assembly protein CpaB